ncbi:hypothetical protein [Paenibacillus segetis]|uniref:DUF4233 domain-containing protein n=1 Tax=Paenibacillus segetis TaxID=1325360 RepID=A0ABQ1YMS0_9BACL|nr:hypothetical protein [Paenibacillus segetis]GGH31953.1 hypothetical protein GCM10008013_36040 [Paenibacillus segetis]
MTNSRVMKWITGSLEIVLAIPLFGAAIVIGSFYTALGIMLILHIVTLVLSSQNNEPKYGSVIGIVTSLVAWVPIVGWILHLLSGIFLMVTAAKKAKSNAPHTFQA